AFPALSELLDLDDAAFEARYRGRAIIRAKRDGMARNACVALGNTGNSADLPALTRALADRSPIVRSHAAWAIEEIARRNGEYESSRPTAG
ncbi:MAG: HEAT repeat domain-containing protein, partial [Tepidiformaceae bacterium]